MYSFKGLDVIYREIITIFMKTFSPYEKSIFYGFIRLHSITVLDNICGLLKQIGFMDSFQQFYVNVNQYYNCDTKDEGII